MVKISKYKTTILLFLIVLIGFLANLPLDYSKSMQTKVYRRLLTSNDVTAATFLPYELITNGTFYLSSDTVTAMKRAEPEVYSIIYKNGHFFSAMPILMGLLAVPVYLIPLLLNKIPSLQYAEDLINLLTLGRIAASFYTAISVTVFYLILKELDKLKVFKTDRWTYIFLGFFAFGTNVYSIASRSLYQHTSSLLFVTLIILFLLKSTTDSKYVKYLGLFAAFLYLARPLNLVFVALLTGYVFIRHRKQFVSYLLFALPLAIALFTYNSYAWGTPFTTEYVEKNDTSFSTPLWEGLGGYLVSPARSYLFITPPLLTGFYTMFLTFKKKKKEGPDKVFILLSITFIIMLLLYSMWHDWYGGDRFGYALLTEWTPIIALFSYLFIKPLRVKWKLIFVIFLLWSVYVQTNAVWNRKSRCSGKSHNWSFYCLKSGFFTDRSY